MSFQTSSARLAQASPSVSLEKGAYRLRAPRTCTASFPNPSGSTRSSDIRETYYHLHRLPHLRDSSEL
ncbi:hypothetical protein A0H81_07340 [Grifola frondosa]|uniref:Uncharacterized protein n=1 Tax=Grifola frondosa TaxID=5627 RepID=A0A1C7M9W2_GRIFR|nr:hypothetical protein A0H81_07340 [Grifola frondosa]